MTDKIKEIIDKYPWLLMVVPIIIVAIIAFFLLSEKHNSPGSTQVSTGSAPNSQSTSVSNSQASSASSNSQTSGFNPFVFLLRLLGFDKQSNTSSQTANGTSNTVDNSQTSQTGSSSNQTTGSNNSTSTTTGGSTQNTTGSSQTLQSSGVSPTPATPIQIIFKAPGGGTQVYIPPVTPPVDITWGRYVNAADRYSIDYPTNWQVVKTEYNGHEGVSIYLPGTNPGDPNVQYIGFGLATYYLLPGQNSQQSTYSYPISVGSTNGTMDTQGVLGNGSMAAVFSYEQGSFGLGSNVSDPDFIYVYNYMLQSLTFGPQ